MNIWEILVILLVALVVIKPNRLPEIAYTLGLWAARLRRFSQSFFDKYQNLL